MTMGVSANDPTVKGWKAGKFVVRHYRRGDLLDGEAFVLVPERDPAAISALRAYAKATPDIDLGRRLEAWAAMHDPNGEVSTPTIDDRLPTLIATYAEAVEKGQMDLTTALFRIAQDVMSCRELSTVR